jgi:DNA-binding NtrC family response regulator
MFTKRACIHGFRPPEAHFSDSLLSLSETDPLHSTLFARFENLLAFATVCTMIRESDHVEKGMSLQERVALYEKSAIEKCPALQSWHRGRTATALGIDRKTLYTKMKAYGRFSPQTG